MKKILLMCVMVCVLFSVGCSRTDDDKTNTTVSVTTTTKGNVSIGIVSLVEGTASSGAPQINVHIVNSGSEIAQNISCTVNATSNGIEAESVAATITLTNGVDLGLDVATELEAVFSSLSSHADYDALAFQFDWQEDYTDSVSY
jgi:hypothetical protein